MEEPTHQKINNSPTILISIAIIVTFIIGIGLLFWFLNTREQPLDLTDAVAVVERKKITKTDYQKMLDRDFYISKSANHNYATESARLDSSPSAELKNTTLEKMIDYKIIETYAEKNKITVTDEEVNRKYQSALPSFGKTEQEALATIKKNQNIDKDLYLKLIKESLLSDKVNNTLSQSLPNWLESQKKHLKIQRLI